MRTTSSENLQGFRFALVVSSVPFLLTFLLVGIFAWRRLFPLLARNENEHLKVACARGETPDHVFGTTQKLKSSIRLIIDRPAAITFSVTISLSAVLAELVFCEISDTLNPAARKLALESTISVLLMSLIIVTPVLEIHSIVSSVAGLRLRCGGSLEVVVAVIFDILGLAIWLFAFWWIGKASLGAHHGIPTAADTNSPHGFSEASLERVGIIGISLMATLAGFAAVSSLWQTFGAKAKPVTEVDVRRKRAGLDATNDLLRAKQSRLGTLEQKMAKTHGGDSLLTRIMGSLRGDSDTQERASLRIEIQGFETMQASLSQSLSYLETRLAAQEEAKTTVGRFLAVASHTFSIYCLYRISTTVLATVRRCWPSHDTSPTFASSSDPINRALALVAKHAYPALDRTAWSRQISFLLSGLMLMASFNAVIQTVVLFSRLTPAHSMLRVRSVAQQNFALLVSQISGTYVVSSALLLRINLPKEMGSVIEDALGRGGVLDSAFVESWFEGWFLASCTATAIGIWVSQRISTHALDRWDDEEYGLEEAQDLGKFKRMA